MATAPPEVGDFLPPRAVSDNSGSTIDFQHPSQAGQGLLFAVVSPDKAARMAEELARQSAGLGQGLLRSFVVCRQAIAGWAGLVPLLIDEQGAFGAETLLLAGFDGRILARLALDSLAGVLSLWQGEVVRTQPVVIGAQAPVLLIDGILEPPLCTALLDYWAVQPKTANAVASLQQGNSAQIQSHKRRNDVVLDDPQLYQRVMLRIAHRVLPTIRKAFQMEIQRAEALRIGCYDARDRGAFARHRDNTTPYTAHRRFALSLNLNAGAYEGGELCFPEFGRMLYSPPSGGGVVFSCALLHEALPVTAGRRFGLFTFLNDRTAVEAEDRMRRQLGPQP